MTDALDLLARRNPVDEASLPARDARAVGDLSRIMGEPVQSRSAVRRPAGRTRRLAFGVAGVTGIAALMGGLFLFAPARDPRPGGPAALNGASWGMEATVRVTPRAGGPALGAATRRAAAMLQARARAAGPAGAHAEVTGQGTVRLTVPWATLPIHVNRLIEQPSLTVYDLNAERLGDSRGAASAIRALRGPASAQRGDGWYAFTLPELGLLGKYARREPGVPNVTWVQPAVGRVAITAEGLLATRGRRAGFPFIVLRDDPVAQLADVITVTEREGRLVIRLDADSRLRGDQVVVFGDQVIGVVAGRREGAPSHEVRMVGAAEATGFARVLAGGGVDADLAVSRLRPVGDASVRRGDSDAEVPPLVRRWLTDFAGTRALPATLIRVLTTGTGRDALSIWEVLTADGGNASLSVGPGEGGGTSNCALDGTASTIRRCVWGSASAYGRVAPSVARVETRFRDGGAKPAIVQNGWFLARSRAEKGATIVALDKDGKVLREIPR